MNKMRRKEIFRVIQQLNNILFNITNFTLGQLVEMISDIVDMIQDIYDEEEAAMDNTPENLQNSQRYEDSEYACDNLLDSIDELEEIDEDYSKEDIEQCLTNVINNLNNCL